MIRYILEKIYHYSTALTSWSWIKLYGDRSKGLVTEKNRFNKLQQEQRDLDESYQQSKRNKKEREDYFERKSVKQLLEEMDQDELKEIEDRNGF